MLDKLSISNCKITPRFKEDIYEYNVYCDSQNKLDFKYDESLDITIYGNNLSDGENHVLLEYYNNAVYSYKFNVYNKDKTISNAISIPKANSIYKESNIHSYIIAIIVIIIIVILYGLFFRKHK